MYALAAQSKKDQKELRKKAVRKILNPNTSQGRSHHRKFTEAQVGIHSEKEHGEYHDTRKGAVKLDPDILTPVTVGTCGDAAVIVPVPQDSGVTIHFRYQPPHDFERVVLNNNNDNILIGLHAHQFSYNRMPCPLHTALSHPSQPIHLDANHPFQFHLGNIMTP